MSPRALEQVLAQLDEAEGGARDANDAPARRGHVRLPFPNTKIMTRLKQKSGQEAVLCLASRNVSGTGVSLLHSAFVHPGTRCALALPHATKKFIRVTGEVVRCGHRFGAVHEIGVKFDPGSRIDVRDLLGLDRMSTGPTLERVEPSELTGRVLLIEDSEPDRRLIRHFLRGTEISLRDAGTIDEAKDELQGGVDAVITDYHLPGGKGVEIIPELSRPVGRTLGPLPIVVLTADVSPEVRTECHATGVEAVLTKPIQQAVLHRVLAEILGIGASPPKDTMGADEGVREIVRKFQESLGEIADELEACFNRGDAESARSAAVRVGAGATSLGFTAVRDAANSAAERLAQTGSTAESESVLRELCGSCRRAHAA